MSDACCRIRETGDDPAYRRTLIIVLIVNAGMFVVETVAGLATGSTALQADALDFLGDAANYGISLFLLGRSLRLRANGSLLKAATMMAFGVWVLIEVARQLATGALPVAGTMGVIGAVALAANLLSFALLSRHARDDSNRLSAWLCSRNDMLGNVAVLVAAGLVHLTSSRWPDAVVALTMAGLALSSALQVFKRALSERKELP